MTDALAILRDPYLQVTYLFVTGVAAIYCLIGLWAATSRQHWFLRAIVPCLALAALIPIRAHEPLIFYALIMAEIVLVMTIWRWWRGVGPACRVGPEGQSNADARSRSVSGTYQRFRFGLRDLFLLTLIGGILAWMFAACSRVELLLDWPGAIAAASQLAVVSLCSWNVVSARRRWLATGLLTLAVAAAVTIEVMLLRDWLKVSVYIQTVEHSARLHDATIVSFLYAEFVVLLLIAMVLMRSARKPATTQFGRRAAWLTGFGAAALASIPLATLYWRMLQMPEFPPRVVPEENAFPTILDLGAKMESSTPAQAEAVYEQLRPLLDRPGHVPLDPSLSFAYPTEKDLYWQRCRRIGRAIGEQAAGLINAGKFDEAADRYLSIMKLGQMLSRGGGYYDVLVGNAVEGAGSFDLIKIRHRLSLEMRSKLLRAGMAFEEAREPVPAAMQRDAAYLSRTMRWRWALERQLPFQLFGLQFNGDEVQEFQLEDYCDRLQSRGRLLYTDLAVRSFHHDHGRLPGKLEDLVPKYLPAVSIDLYTDRQLVYRPSGNSFILYSVGPDRIDNGGTPKSKGQNIMTPGIDWDLDSIVAP